MERQLFGNSYIERARQLREQLSQLQPIQMESESGFENNSMVIEGILERNDGSDEAAVLPSQAAFMKLNSFKSTAQ